MHPQPPADAPAPDGISSFYRIGPWTLIVGSFCVYGTLLLLAEALQWKDFHEGIGSGVFIAILAMIVVLPVQFLIAMACMSRKRRGRWRTATVLLPAALVSLLALYLISTLYPHQRRARNELGRLLGGPVPNSVDNLSLNYRCDAFGATLWTITFDISPEDWEAISNYPIFPAGSQERSFWQPRSVHSIYEGSLRQLEFDPRTRRGRYTVSSD